jgi:hypothetical protein
MRKRTRDGELIKRTRDDEDTFSFKSFVSALKPLIISECNNKDCPECLGLLQSVRPIYIKPNFLNYEN